MSAINRAMQHIVSEVERLQTERDQLLELLKKWNSLPVGGAAQVHPGPLWAETDALIAELNK